MVDCVKSAMRSSTTSAVTQSASAAQTRSLWTAAMAVSVELHDALQIRLKNMFILYTALNYLKDKFVTDRMISISSFLPRVPFSQSIFN